jgi:hypothetical protein
VYADGTVHVDSNAVLLTSSSSLSLNTWTFVTVCRRSGTMTMYFNGTSVASASNSSNFTQTGTRVGGTFDNLSFNGYIDDLRVTKGYARYTANFTPPTTAFPTY